MVAAYFTFLILIHGAICAVFVRNYLKRRQPASLVVLALGLMACAWFAREMHWLPRYVATPILALAGPMGILGLLICLNAERQR